MESGYSRIILDSWTPALNPTEISDAHAEKKVVTVATLTKTITQHWAVHSTDKMITMRWACLDKADKDTLKTKYEASYDYYSFRDVYNTSYNVVITYFRANRITTLDADGFDVELHLQIV